MSLVHFARSQGFYAELKRRVARELAERGIQKYGGLRIALKAIAIFALLIASYSGLVFFATTLLQVALFAFLLSQALVLIGFNVMHDGGHGSFSKRRWVNRLAGLALDLIGGSQQLWKTKHGVLHHSYTNIADLDDDLDGNGLLRLHPEQPWKPLHRMQAFYAPLLYSLLGVHWVFSDFTEFFSGRIGGHPTPKPRRRDIAIFLVFKVSFLFLAFIIPSLFNPWYWVILTWLGVMLVAGFAMALVFQLAHVVDGVEMVANPANGHLEDEWAVHQLRTTANFAPKNRVLEWYVGGLNRQVEHHLFSTISHVRYRAIAPTVQAVCCEYGVEYREYRTFRDALRAHFRMLHSLGRNPLAPVAAR